MGKTCCLACEQVCVCLFLFIPAAFLVPCIAIGGIVVASLSLDQVAVCDFQPRYSYYYYYNYCDKGLFTAGFSLLIVISICACQISCCVVYARLRESSWRKNKLNQTNNQRSNQQPQRENDYFSVPENTPRTPPPSYLASSNERARIIPTYNQVYV